MSNDSTQIIVDPIGTIRTPFSQKFGIPRQSVGLSNIPGQIILHPPYDDINGFRGIEAFSHLWILFQFNQSVAQTEQYSPLIRPPRLGGNDKMGVFASRSSFRPNNIGMSLVQFDRIERKNGLTRLHVLGVDCLDNTPIIDIKPYIRYADSQDDARCGYAQSSPSSTLNVLFSSDIMQLLSTLSVTSNWPSEHTITDVQTLISTIIGLDPRPAYHQAPEYQSANPNKPYHVKIYNLDITFWVDGDQNAHITAINP